MFALAPAFPGNPLRRKKISPRFMITGLIVCLLAALVLGLGGCASTGSTGNPTDDFLKSVNQNSGQTRLITSLATAGVLETVNPADTAKLGWTINEAADAVLLYTSDEASAGVDLSKVKAIALEKIESSDVKFKQLISVLLGSAIDSVQRRVEEQYSGHVDSERTTAIKALLRAVALGVKDVTARYAD